MRRVPPTIYVQCLSSLFLCSNEKQKDPGFETTSRCFLIKGRLILCTYENTVWEELSIQLLQIMMHHELYNSRNNKYCLSTERLM